jgi:hypothetical protein
MAAEEQQAHARGNMRASAEKERRKAEERGTGRGEGGTPIFAHSRESSYWTSSFLKPSQRLVPRYATDGVKIDTLHPHY